MTIKPITDPRLKYPNSEKAMRVTDNKTVWRCVDRQSFLNKLGDCHYSLEEIKRGVYWKKVKQYV
jgi:hypothetical protein